VNGLYVFALAGEEAAPFLAAGHRVETVRIGDVYAAVERVSQAPSVSEEALRTQHEVVTQVASRVAAVLPARFGAFVGRRELRALVRQRRQTILEALTLVRHRSQMTVRLLGPEPAEVPATREGPRPTTGTGYLESRRDLHGAREMPAALGAVAGVVRDFVVAERTEAGRGRVIATLYHLVDTDKVHDYENAIAPARAQAGDVPLTVSGPWPPFAFAPDIWL
jgi:hypothetical protein